MLDALKLLLSLPRILLQWAFLLLSNLVLDPLGLLVVAVAIPFRVADKSVSDGRHIENLPRWAWLWGNDFDGLLGDRRYWWDVNADEEILWGLLPLLRKIIPRLPMLHADCYLAMWWWAAIRNPTNNMRRLALYSCPVAECSFTGYGQAEVNDKPGQGGWQFVIGKRGWRRWYGFYWVHQWNDSKAFVVRLGFKINARNYPADTPPIGFTIKVVPNKSIG